MPLGPGRGKDRVLVGGLLALVTGGAFLVGSVIEVSAAGAQTAPVVVARGAAASAAYAVDSTRSIRLPVPAGAVPGDALIASLGIVTGSSVSPAIIAPSGWTLASRTDAGNQRTVGVFWHLLTTGESAFTWTTDVSVGGSAFLVAFSGTDPTSPVEVSSGRSVTRTTSVSSPSVTTGVPNSGLVSSYLGYTGKKSKTSWKPPSGMTELGDAGDGSHVFGSIDFALQGAAGASGQKTATASVAQDYAIGVLTALRPATSPADSTPPVISAVSVGSVTATSANLSWTTDEPSDTQIDYGPTTAYGTSTTLDPAPTTTHAQTITSLTAGTTYHYRVRSRDPAGNPATSSDLTFQTTPPTTGPVPLIIDTDIFSNTDDVGALATAFGLQIRGEARVLAIGVNTRTSRPTVATNSWKCVAAIAQFYNAGSIPIGTDMPNNGTETNTVDFIGPCARYASPATPTPATAVTVYRQTLTGQADASVVFAAIGYSENLAALLDSPPDAISPLSGRELVARKVRLLSIMAGGYPSRSGENNLAGNPAAAQNVATNWPTRIAWSGYEVGDAVHTGNTISSTHPLNSPVRVSYEAFVGPNNRIYSYDLTAVYHAVRPNDPLLSEVGPGTNTVTSTGANTFTAGSGNQYYLRLANATTLAASIETLLTTLPATPPADTTPPVISAVSVGSVTATSATVSWTTDEPADTQIDYGPTAAYGTSTTLDPATTTMHGQTITNLTAGTTSHYRVRSRDPAGNPATSADLTFQTTPPATGGPNDTFDANAIDLGMWVVTSNGSTVAAANQQLEISHPAGAWTTGALQSARPHDQTGLAVRVQMKRAANNGLSGSAYGETSVFLWLDATHYVEFFVAGGSLTAWVGNGAAGVNLTPSWPAYNPGAAQWLRFRETGGTLYWEFADGSTTPGTWNVLASTPVPFDLRAVTLKIVAGSNTPIADTAIFDNITSS